MLIAVFSALIALAISGGHDAAAHSKGLRPDSVRAATITKKELALRRRCESSGRTTSPGRAWRSSA